MAYKQLTITNTIARVTLVAICVLITLLIFYFNHDHKRHRLDELFKFFFLFDRDVVTIETNGIRKFYSAIYIQHNSEDYVKNLKEKNLGFKRSILHKITGGKFVTVDLGMGLFARIPHEAIIKIERSKINRNERDY